MSGLSASRSCDLLRPFLSEHSIERLYAPTEDGTTLPNAAYADEGFLRLENQYLYPRTWVFAGCLHDVAQPGAQRIVLAGES